MFIHHGTATKKDFFLKGGYTTRRSQNRNNSRTQSGLHWGAPIAPFAAPGLPSALPVVYPAAGATS